MALSEYWVDQWMTAHGITSVDGARAALASPSVRRDLADRAGRDTDTGTERSARGFTLLAGSGLDLSEWIGCGHLSCLQEQINTLFRRGWHYFDEIIVRDGWRHEIASHVDSLPTARRDRFLDHIALLIYLKDIGADDVVTFLRKWRPHLTEFEANAQHLGVPQIVGILPVIVRDLVANAQRTPNGDGTYTLLFPDGSGLIFPAAIAENDAELRASLVATLEQRWATQLFVDISTAPLYNATIGSNNWFYRAVLAPNAQPKEAASGAVAFDLELPFVDGVSVADLVGMRREYAEDFARFQTAIRSAIAERTAQGLSGKNVSVEIRREMIDPALARIAADMKRASTSFQRKAGSSILAGVALTSVGAITGIGGLVPAGILAGVHGVAKAHQGKVTDESRIADSDMFFLWEALARPH